MYLKNERPIIRATIYYYDTKYALNTSYAVLNVLKKYHMYPPEKINADKLTKNRFISFDENTDNLFSKAYCEKDVLQIDIASGNIRSTADYWRVSWGLTFYKNSKLAVSAPQFMPWNTLSIDSSHTRLEDTSKESAYLSCIKELIEILNPFYVSIDDVNNKVLLMNQVKETKFVPDRVQQIFWGNYWGPSFCVQYRDAVLKIPAKNVELCNNGVFFTLSDNILDFNTNECRIGRQSITRFLN